MVCTQANHTYTSDCEFYQMQCWCRKNDQRCTRKEALIDSIDYFGRCQSKKKKLKQNFYFDILFLFLIRSWYLYRI
jgi:hypothetical protein